MKHAISFVGLSAGLLVASLASATVVTLPTSTFNFAYNSGGGVTYSNGVVFDNSTGQSITVFDDTVSNNSSNGTGTGNPGVFNGNDSGLFAVTSGDGGNIASGIAPYVASEGGYTHQNGITDGDVILLELKNFTAGTTLSLLLQEGVANDSYNVYTLTSSTTPTGIGAGEGSNPMTKVASDISVAGSGNPYTITATGGTEWIAIQADCTYLLLDSITLTSPSGVPEPRFYGLLLAALLGLGGVMYQRRRAA